MKYLIVLFVVVGAALGEEYTSKFDNINLQEIMENERLVHNYYECIMEIGKCTPEGKELKEHIQEGLETGCGKCSDKQKQGVIYVTQMLIKNYIDKWYALTAKFDPAGKWRQHYEVLAKENGIEIPK